MPRLSDRDWLAEYRRVGDEPNEGEERLPRETNTTRPTQLFVKPLAGGVVLWSGAIGGEDEQIGVDEDHR